MSWTQKRWMACAAGLGLVVGMSLLKSIEDPVAIQPALSAIGGESITEGSSNSDRGVSAEREDLWVAEKSETFLVLADLIGEMSGKETLTAILNASPPQNLTNALVKEWARRDAEGMFRACYAFAAFPENGEVRKWAEIAINALIKNEPDVAVFILEQIPESKWARELRLCAIGTAKSLGNFDQAFDQQGRWKNGGWYGAGNDEAMRLWFLNDPQAAVAKLSRIHPAPQKVEFKKIGKWWSEHDAAAAFAAAETLGAHARAAFLGGLVETLGKDQPLEILELLKTEPEAAVRAALVEPAVRSAAQYDPAMAILWCEENLSGKALKDGITAAIKEVVEIDFTVAGEVTTAMAPGVAKNVATSELLGTLITRLTPGSTSKPLIREYRRETLPQEIGADGDRGIQSASKIAEEGDDISFLISWAVGISDPEARRYAITENAWRLYRKFPEAAAALAESDDRSIATARLLSTVGSSLAKDSTEAAMVWLQRLSTESQASVGWSVRNAIIAKTPAEAGRWVMALEDPGAREVELNEFSRSGAWIPVPALQRWLNALPASERERSIDVFREVWGSSAAKKLGALGIE